MHRFTLATFALTILTILAGCSTPMGTAEPETIRSDAVYLPNARMAREAKRIWDNRHPNNYTFLAGSPRESAYTQPVPLVYTPPVFPPELAAAGLQGDVIVEAMLGSSGEVLEAFVVRSSDRRFEEAALRAVREWKFQPKRYNGVPTMAVVSQLIEFRLN